MRHHPVRHSLPFLLVALVIVGAACSDDDSDTSVASLVSEVPTETAVATTAVAQPVPTEAGSTAPAPPVETASPIDPADAEWCAAVEAINAAGAMPTVDDVLAYQGVAPAELQEPLQVVIDALEAANGDFMAVFADEEAGAALEEITALEEARCGTGEQGPPQDPMVTVIDEAATRVDVVATEYAFDVDLPTTAGPHSFVMRNDGAEPHIMILLRLADGATIEEVLTSQGEEGVAEEYESSPATPGAEGVLTADLTTGSWALLCPIPGPSGAPHFADGMLTEFAIA